MRRILLASTAALLVGAVVPANASPSATLTVLHGLPHFTADVYVNGKLTLNGFKPEDAAGPLQLPAGTYQIAIRNVGADPASTPALAGAITLQAGLNYTAIAHLTGSGSPALSLFRNTLKPVPAGRARLLLRNTAQVDPLDLRLNGRTVFSDVKPSQDPATLLSPGRYRVVAVPASGSTTPLFPGMPLRVQAGMETDMYVVGSSADHSLDFMVQNFTHLGAPLGVPSGSGGFASPPGFPAWALALMVVAALAGVYGVATWRRQTGMVA